MYFEEKVFFHRVNFETTFAQNLFYRTKKNFLGYLTYRIGINGRGFIVFGDLLVARIRIFLELDLSKS